MHLDYDDSMRNPLSSLLLAGLAVPSIFVASGAGCVTSNDPPPSQALPEGGAFDSGGPSPNDANLPGTDTGTTDSGGGNDTGTDAGNDAGGDGGTSGPLATCDAPARVDTLRGVDGSVTISATGYGDKWVVTWYQLALVSPDSMYHWKARTFDGAALATEIDLGTDVFGNQSPIVSDGAGHAFAQRFRSSDGERRVFDFASGTFAAGTAFPQVNSAVEIFALAAIPGGGAMSLFRDGTNVLADKWLSGSWAPTNLAGSPGLSFGLRLAVNAAGKAVALWYNANAGGPGGNDLHVAAYDGAAWSAPVTLNLPNAVGQTSTFTPVVLSNGDAIIGYLQGADTIVSHRFHPNGTFDAPIPVESSAGATAGKFAIVADASDRVTFAFLKAGHVHVRRDLGAGYLAEQDVTTGTDYRLDVNPATQEVTLVTYKMPTLQVQRIAPTSNTWTASIPLNMGISNGTLPQRQAAVVFDSAGRPTVLSMQEAAGAGGLELFSAKCR